MGCRWVEMWFTVTTAKGWVWKLGRVMDGMG